MIDRVEFYNRLKAKMDDVMFKGFMTGVGRAFNDGVQTALNYAYVIASEMEDEAKEG